MKPKCGSELGKAAEVDLAHRRARNTKSASPSCQRSVHFGPVTEIGQQRGDKMSISRAGPGSESEEEPDSCTVKAYTCHQLPSVSSAIILNSQDNAMGDKSQIRAHSEVILASQKAIRYILSSFQLVWIKSLLEHLGMCCWALLISMILVTQDLRPLSPSDTNSNFINSVVMWRLQPSAK